jgi:hypothetical protein
MGPMDPLVKRWVETWRRAGPELEAIHRAELQSVDTREAVRQLFGNYKPTEPAPPWSGLVEQQRWFAKLSRRDR